MTESQLEPLMITWIDEYFSLCLFFFFTFSFIVDPLKYKWDDFLWVDVSVSSDVLDGLQAWRGTHSQQEQQ